MYTDLELAKQEFKNQRDKAFLSHDCKRYPKES